jgi:hypothetical protein
VPRQHDVAPTAELASPSETVSLYFLQDLREQSNMESDRIRPLFISVYCESFLANAQTE